MNEENEKGLDDLFKNKLEDPVDQVSFREEDWAALEKMLKKQKEPKGIVYWLPLLSGVAALLLLFLGWLAFRAKDSFHNTAVKQVAVIKHQQVNTGTRGGSTRQPTYHNPNKTPLPVHDFASGSNQGKTGSKSQLLFTKSAGGARRTTGLGKTIIKDTIVGRSDEALFTKNNMPVFQHELITAQPLTTFNLLNKNAVALVKSVPVKNSIKRTQPGPFRPQFAIAVLAAPDINGVGSFQQSKVGTNIGMQFSATISKKFSITTGGIYSVKPYSMAFENYHTPYKFQVTPTNVTADCRMLDIPIDLGYQLYSARQNKISIGTGLSSYIMLHESYKFNYANSYTNPYVSAPSNYTVPNSGKYFFGVLNLNATYQRQLNQKVGFTVQPYLKLPLSNIGYSQVRLQTTGVAIGLSWNLNTSTP